MMDKVVRIGGASGFWGDSSVGAPQLVAKGQVDYLVFDYLAELTMSILAAARAKDPELGYATDFVAVTLKGILKDVAAQGIRVISNAGGVNPQACARAIAALAAEQGVDIKIAVVLGDDATALVPELRGEDVRELQSGAAMPAKLLTANAYLGALPVKQALDAGAQIVVTGRCVDSAVTLGALMHEFGWAADDWDRLAQGSLPGQSGTSSQSVCRPPVAWQPHSMMWPARLPWARRSQSSAAQPNSCISAPSVTALSTQRPVTTIWAPCRSSRRWTRAPR